MVMTLLSGCNGGMQIDQPVSLVGGLTPKAPQNCVVEFEAVPSFAPGSSPAQLVAALGFNQVSAALGGWQNWNFNPASPQQTAFNVPVNSNDPLQLNGLTGDAYTTYSETKNLVFAYFIGRPSTAQNSCVAVAATDPSKLVTNTWDFPAVCLSSSRGDQCAIIHDDAANTFYSACARGAATGSGIRLEAYKGCAGAPGPAYGCPRTSLNGIPNVNILQFDIAINPCSDNLVIAYRNLNNEVRLRFYDSGLNRLNNPDFLVRANQNASFGNTNAGCTNGTIRRCGLGTSDCCDRGHPNCQTNPTGQCLRVNMRPSIDVHVDRRGGGMECRAAVAYDSLVPGSDGNLWAKSRLDLVRITDEQSPFVERSWNSTDDAFTWNQYLSYVTVNRFTFGLRMNLGWFWISDNRGPCNAGIEGAVSRNLGLSSLSATWKFGGTFPAMVMRTPLGINDYNRGVKGGGPGGFLYPHWGQPVPTTGGCNAMCMGQDWNTSARITRVLP